MKQEKKWVIVYLAMIAIAFFYFVLIALADPIHLYRLPKTGEILWDHNLRQQNASFIRHLDFDSVILGNSHMENTSAKEASDKLGGKFFNLSLAASDNFERSIILKDIFKRRKIKTVILLLSDYIVNDNERRFPLEQFDYLYDDNPLNDIKLYLNARFLTCPLNMLIHRPCFGRPLDLDRPTAWSINKKTISRMGGLEKWKNYKDDKQFSDFSEVELPKALSIKKWDVLEPTEKEKNEIEDTINNTLIRFLKENPQTQFFSYYSPQSLLGNSIRLRKNKMGTYFYYIKKTLELTKPYKNFILFGFDTLNFTNDIAFFMDPIHYHPDKNSDFLTYISKRQYVLTENNVDVYLSEILKRANAFDLQGFSNDLRKILN